MSEHVAHDLQLRTILTQSLVSKDACTVHTEQKPCIVDLVCGWCILPKGGACVQGDYAGPNDKKIPCPIYVTYQVRNEA